MALSPSGFPSDTLPVPQAGARATASEDQQQSIKLQGVIAQFVASRTARPWLAGGVMGLAGLYAVQGLSGEPFEPSLGLPGVPMGGLVAFGAFAGSVVVGGASKVAGIIRNAPLLQDYASAVEVWLKYRLGRIPPEQYYEHCAVLDFQRLYGGLPPNERPKTQAAFTREVVRWRMALKQKKRLGRAARRSTRRALRGS
mgnify:CR=1 FL=1